VDTVFELKFEDCSFVQRLLKWIQVTDTVCRSASVWPRQKVSTAAYVITDWCRMLRSR